MTLDVKASYKLREEKVHVHLSYPEPNERSYQDALKMLSWMARQKDCKMEINF